MPRGGARHGAGRPRGSGRTVEIRSISMPAAAWKKLDELRGATSRGIWISSRIWRLWRLTEWHKALQLVGLGMTRQFGDGFNCDYRSRESGFLQSPCKGLLERSR